MTDSSGRKRRRAAEEDMTLCLADYCLTPEMVDVALPPPGSPEAMKLLTPPFTFNSGGPKRPGGGGAAVPTPSGAGAVVPVVPPNGDDDEDGV